MSLSWQRVAKYAPEAQFVLNMTMILKYRDPLPDGQEAPDRAN